MRDETAARNDHRLTRSPPRGTLTIRKGGVDGRRFWIQPRSPGCRSPGPAGVSQPLIMAEEEGSETRVTRTAALSVLQASPRTTRKKACGCGAMSLIGDYRRSVFNEEDA